jgi:hypothetical protein
VSKINKLVANVKDLERYAPPSRPGLRCRYSA